MDEGDPRFIAARPAFFPARSGSIHTPRCGRVASPCVAAPRRAAGSCDHARMTSASSLRLAVIGGGPAGLMAAETARAAGVEVDLYDATGSVGRKFLLAGKGGLNLTHAEAPARFVERYGSRQAEVGRWLGAFDAQALRAWARELGVETFVGSSGR